MKSKLTPIYAVTSISSLAGSLVGIFIPIFLLSLGYGLRQIMLYCLIRSAAILAFALLPGLSRKRVTLKALMIAQAPVQILILVVLATLKTTHAPIYYLALLQGLQASLYYIPLHVFFTKAADQKSMGRNVGVFLSLPGLFGIGAPLLSGLIAARWGFAPLFYISAAMVAISLVPLSQIQSYHEPMTFSLGRLKHLYDRYRTYFWLEIIENIQEEMDLVIWPLAVYLFARSTIQVGYIATLIGAGSAVFTYLIGRRSDRRAKLPMLRLGALLMLGLWLWRELPLNSGSIVAISAIVSFATVLIIVPFSTIIYGLASQNKAREFIIFREVPVFLARAIVYTIGFVIATYIHNLFWIPIVAYALFAVMPPVMGAQSNPATETK